MSKYIVMQYCDCDKDEWDEYVEKSDEGWFWHTSMFMDAWPYGENKSFCIKDIKSNRIMAMQMLLLAKDEGNWKRWHRIPYWKKKKYRNVFSSIGGLVREDSLTVKEERKLSQFYVDYMDGLVEQFRIGFFSYCVQPTLSKKYWPGVCPYVNPLVFWGYNNRIGQSYIIDLSLDEESIFKGYYQTTRNLIYRCLRDEKIKVVEATSSDCDLDAYYSLHVETYLRTGVNPHPKAYFEAIFKRIMPLGYCRVLFCYDEDKLIAAHNMLLYKGVAMYWTGASITDKGDGESRLLMHEQILYAKRNGYKWFEVGEAFPNVRSGKLKGLNDYKKSFGGQIHPQFAGEYNIIHDSK